MKINYRLPHEFYGLGTNWKGAFRIWLFHYWKGHSLDIRATTGFRILGIEFVFELYK
jgi:hypothetical protein